MVKKNSATELDFCKVNQSFYWSKPLPSHGKKDKILIPTCRQKYLALLLEKYPPKLHIHNEFILMFFVQKLKFFFSFLNRRGLFERASETWKKNSKPLLTQRHLNHFKKNLSLGWTSHIFLHTFVSQIVLNTIHTYFFFRTRNFMNKKLRNVSLCKETITYLSPLHPQKTTHKHVAFTVFLYRQKVSSSP